MVIMQLQRNLGIIKIILFFIIICSSFVSAQTTISGSLIHKGLNRKYRLHLPPGFKPEESLPLVLNYHGFTSNGTQQELMSDMNAVSDTARFLVCYPEGINASWNVGWVFGSTADDIGFTAAMIDEFIDKYNVDKNRVYACGMSNGGFMSYRLACELPSRIAAIASVTGSMVPQALSSCKPGRPVPVMEIHGTSDNIVNYNGSPLISAPIPEVLKLWQKNNGCDDVPNKTFIPDTNPNDGTTTERWIYQNCLDNGELIHYRVLNGGHTWPGSELPGMVTSLDFNASTVIWQFFYNQSLYGLSSLTNNVNRLEMLAYPNPADDKLTLSFPEDRMYNISLFTMTGCKVLETYVSQNLAQIKLDNLRSGMYHVVVKSDSQYASMKFVKL
jgi:polyhydroxybutyrate depolymerase